MAPKISGQANTFQNEWLRHYEGRQPLGRMLRESGNLPWVRFHALTGSKRYAETESEFQTIIFRANALGVRLLGAGSLCWLVEARADKTEGAGSYAGDYVEDDPDGVTWRFYVQPVEWRSGAFDAMLTAVANWEAPPTLWMNRRSGSIFAPYDGGFDLFPRSHGEVESLTAEYKDWLSPHPRGL